MPTAHLNRQLILQQPPPYQIVDRFPDVHAAGTLNNSPALPGGALRPLRVIADTGSNLTTDGKQALIGTSGGAANDPNITHNRSITRQAGIVQAAKCNTGNSSTHLVGWSSTSNGLTYTYRHNWNNGSLRIVPSFPTVAAMLHNSWYWHILVTRATGMFFFLLGADFAYPTLLHIERTTTTTPLWLAWSRGGTNGGNLAVTDMIVSGATYYPAALASDDFTRADGAIGSLNAYDGGPIAAWTDRLGTAVVSSNAAGWSALTSSEALTTVDSGKTDVVMVATLTRSGGVVGLVTRWADASNYVRVVHDGTNVVIVKRVGGVESTVSTTAATYSAGAELEVIWERTTIRVLYNGVLINAGTITDAGIQTGTHVGLYSSNTGNTVDSFSVWARGTGGEYIQYRDIAVLPQQKPLIVFEGDSLTTNGGGVTVAQTYPYQLIDLLGRAAYDYYNVAVLGQTVVQMAADASYQYDPLSYLYSRAICVVWGGTNDIAGGDNATTVYNNISAFCAARKAAGWKVVVCTIIARGTFSGAQNTTKSTVNSSIVSGYTGFADALVDLAADSRLSNASDVTYYNADTVHLNATGYGVVAGLVQTAVQSL